MNCPPSVQNWPILVGVSMLEASFTRIKGTGEESCICRVAEGLGENQWAHLACHGLVKTM